MRIYVASSWRNPRQLEVVEELRGAGLDVYDFRNPREGDRGFHWSEIDPEWKQWSSKQLIEALDHQIAALPEIAGAVLLWLAENGRL